MKLEVKRFNESLRKDFFHVHSTRNQHDFCFCTAWWVPTWEEWGARTSNENRHLREGLLKQGEYDGYLLYVDGTPVGWSQVGLQDRLQKVVQQFSLAPDSETWVITCFFIAPDHARMGYASQLLIRIINDLQAEGVKRVLAFPKNPGDHDRDELWNGPFEMFVEAGFSVLKDARMRTILFKDLTV